MGPDGFFEALEPRTLLDTSPLPNPANLEDAGNAVVRIETRLGDVDIELFESDAPDTTDTFLTLLRRGDYANTFFDHVQPGVRLWGGLFTFDDSAGLSEREGLHPIDATTERSNSEMTVAMLALDNDGQIETSGEFVFNLADNPAADTSFTVFGRVIQGWSVILQIAALPDADFSSLFPGNPAAATLTNVPVTATPPITTVTEDILVVATDAQVIKPAGVQSFFTERVYFPDGYSWERTFESIELANSSGDDIQYQIIVRYETGSRDQVVATGTVEAERRTSAVIAPGFGDASSIVRNNTPYAYEVWSTAPLAAGFRHKDLGAGVGAPFFRPASLPAPAGQTAMQEWTFVQGARGFDTSSVFILWQNTTGFSATVSVAFYFENADPVVYSYALDPHRRGGVNVGELQGFPAGTAFAGARVTSDQPIVASITRYDTLANGGSADQGGVAALGTPGGGAADGLTPSSPQGSPNPLAILNTTGADASINFFITQEGSAIPEIRSVIVPAGRLTVLSGSQNPASAAQSGDFFSLRYASTVPLTVGFLSSDFRGPAAPASKFAATTAYFTDARGFSAPIGSPFGQQTVSIFNPAGTAASIVIRFIFDGEDPVTAPVFFVNPGEAAGRNIAQDYSALIEDAIGDLDQLAEQPYTIIVESDVPVIVQLVQLGGNGNAAQGLTLETWEPLTALVTA